MNNNIAIEILGYPGSHFFCTIDGTMLAACATESHLEGAEVAFKIFLDTLADKSFGMGEEEVDSRFLLEEFYDRTVLAGVGFVLWVASWVGERTAVEDEATAVA